MPEYTYHGGQKLYLNKRPDAFVTRATPDVLIGAGLDALEQVSSSSTRVKTSPADLEKDMEAAREIAPTHHAYALDETDEDFLITDRIFVRFRGAMREEDVAAFAGKYGLFIVERYNDREYLLQVLTAAGQNPVKVVVDITENAADVVDLAEHDANIIASTYAHPLPTDPFFRVQWHINDAVVDTDFQPFASSRCRQAWDVLNAHGSGDVVIGVTDDGCRLDHIDFSSQGKFANWGYFTGTRLVRRDDADADPAKMYQTGANHGTSCAGVIAAESDSDLTVGAAPNCRLLPIKWESQGPSLFIGGSKLLTAINFMADRVDVVSNSWGGRPSTLWPQTVKDRIRDLGQSGGRRGRGIVFLWAAGNENCPVVHNGNTDIPYTRGWERQNNVPVWIGVRTSKVFVNELVGIPNVVHIAALASTGQRSHYSNYGTGVTLCAPSNNVHTYLRLTVRGLGVTTATGAGNGVTDSFGGTSSATPLVAGVAALVISANPTLSAVEVISILKRTAARNGFDLTAYPRTPPAVFDMATTWDVSPVLPATFGDIGDPDGTWSPWFGHGRVDAEEAVRAALAAVEMAVVPCPPSAAEATHRRYDAMA